MRLEVYSLVSDGPARLVVHSGDVDECIQDVKALKHTRSLRYFAVITVGLWIVRQSKLEQTFTCTCTWRSAGVIILPPSQTSLQQHCYRIQVPGLHSKCVRYTHLPYLKTGHSCWRSLEHPAEYTTSNLCHVVKLSVPVYSGYHQRRRSKYVQCPQK